MGPEYIEIPDFHERQRHYEMNLQTTLGQHIYMQWKLAADAFRFAYAIYKLYYFYYVIYKLYYFYYVMASCTIQVLYKYYTSTVQVLYKYCTSTVQVLNKYCTGTVQVLYKYYTSTIQVLFSKSTLRSKLNS